MTILCDSSEPWPHPWATHFSADVRLVRGHLDCGDFAVAALPEGAVCERRAPGEMLSALGQDRANFEATLRRGRHVGRLVVVVEASLGQVLDLAEAHGGGLSEAAIIGSLAAFQRRYAPFFFAGSVRIAAQFTERFLRGQIKEVQRDARAIARTEKATKP